MLTIQWSDLHRLNFKCPSFICPPTVLLGTKYFGRHFSVTSKQINVNQALTSSQH
jgi:hypothetical protein